MVPAEPADGCFDQGVLCREEDPPTACRGSSSGCGLSALDELPLI